MSQETGYRLLNVFLLNSNFKRSEKLTKNEEIKNNADVSVDYSKNEEEAELTVKLTISYWTERRDDPQTKENEAEITMIGIFKYPENPQPPVETFGKINGPAIIFPFIREHLSSLTSKSGIQPILLPPINFAAMAEDEKNDD